MVLWLALLAFVPTESKAQEPVETLSRVYSAVIIEDGRVDYRRLKKKTDSWPI